MCPPEIWTLIFGYLNLENLAEVESNLVRSITHRIATSVISDIIAYCSCRVDRLPNLPAKAQIQRIRNGLRPGPSYFDTCRPLQLRSYSHAFQRKENTAQLTLQLESLFCRNPRFGNPQDIHPCENGLVPIEIIGFTADFTSVHLPDDLCGSLRLDYSTVGMSIHDQLKDVHLDEGHLSRTISHRLSWDKLRWHTSGMCQNEYMDLPKEWVGFLDDQVDVMLRFEKTPSLTHWIRRGEQMQIVECTPFVFKDFKATLTFSSVPFSIEQLLNGNSKEL